MIAAATHDIVGNRETSIPRDTGGLSMLCDPLIASSGPPLIQKRHLGLCRLRPALPNAEIQGLRRESSCHPKFPLTCLCRQLASETKWHRQTQAHAYGIYRNGKLLDLCNTGGDHSLDSSQSRNAELDVGGGSADNEQIRGETEASVAALKSQEVGLKWQLITWTW